jgi:hypothetical protein
MREIVNAAATRRNWWLYAGEATIIARRRRRRRREGSSSSKQHTEHPRVLGCIRRMVFRTTILFCFTFFNHPILVRGLALAGAWQRERRSRRYKIFI